MVRKSRVSKKSRRKFERAIQRRANHPANNTLPIFKSRKIPSLFDLTSQQSSNPEET